MLRRPFKCSQSWVSATVSFQNFQDTQQEGIGDDGATFRIKSAPYDRLFPLCARPCIEIGS